MSNNTCEIRSACKNGLIIPLWRPTTNLSIQERLLKIAVYFLGLTYCFYGVSIISDKFMEAIVFITSMERKKKLVGLHNKKTTIVIKIWNKTVSNLTLMALGSSAPEILLTTIETLGNNFESGDLGAGTIIGSASFNLFIIIGLCIVIIPSNETRKISEFLVFLWTSFISVFAYVWLYIVLQYSTPDVVTVWEALVTLLLFPFLVITSYLIDIKIFSKKIKCNKNILASSTVSGLSISSRLSTNLSIEEIKPIDIVDKDFIILVRELRLKYPLLTMSEIEKIAIIKSKNKPKFSRAYYRMTTNAKSDKFTPRMTSTVQDIYKTKELIKTKSEEKQCQFIIFNPRYYSVFENSGTVEVKLIRSGFGIDFTQLQVEVFTKDGSANSKNDYVSKTEMVTFEINEFEKTITIEIVDDEFFEEDEYFYCYLRNPLITDVSNPEFVGKIDVFISECATIMILDDDYPGIFEFDKDEYIVEESCKMCTLILNRKYGRRGNFIVSIIITESTALPDKHYKIDDLSVLFLNNQTTGKLEIEIIDNLEYTKLKRLNLKIIQPGRSVFDKNITVMKDMDFYRMPEKESCSVIITESEEFRNIVTKINRRDTSSEKIGQITWEKQISSAFELDPAIEKFDFATVIQLSLFILSFPWDLICALIPPPCLFEGWLCFSAAVLTIGLLTAVICDLASHFGCFIGLTDYITAIVFVAIGTSLPDTFASKIAAINEPTADSSIGNVVGSNAVNIFLGFGLSWTIASIEHRIYGVPFKVTSGSLGFSVLLFICLAFVAITCLILRRYFMGGELGGITLPKYISGALFVSLWIIYVTLSVLNEYCLLP